MTRSDDVHYARLGQLERAYPQVVPSMFRILRDRGNDVATAVRTIERRLTERGMVPAGRGGSASGRFVPSSEKVLSRTQNVLKCRRCKLSAVKWTCRSCGRRTCEHRCTYKKDDGSALCTACWRKGRG